MEDIDDESSAVCGLCRYFNLFRRPYGACSMCGEPVLGGLFTDSWFGRLIHHDCRELAQAGYRFARSMGRAARGD